MAIISGTGKDMNDNDDEDEVEVEDEAGKKMKLLRVAYVVVHILGNNCREDEKKGREH